MKKEIEDNKRAEPITPFERALISNYKDFMLEYLQEHPLAFEEAVKLSFSDRQPFAWRAGSLVWNAMMDNDKRVRKYISKIIKNLPTARDNQKRELLKILLLMKLNENEEGEVFDISIAIWQNINLDPSIRVAAFKMIVTIGRNYPELKHEILLLLHENYLKTLSPGVRKSVHKMVAGEKFI